MEEGSSCEMKTDPDPELVLDEPVTMETGGDDVVIIPSAEEPSSSQQSESQVVIEPMIETASGDVQPPDETQTLVNQLRQLETEKANAERGFHNVSTELNDLKAKNSGLVEQNKWLKDRNEIQEKECLDRQRLYQDMENRRNDAAARILRLETELNKMRSEKEEEIFKKEVATRDLQGLLTENLSMKEQLKLITSEKADLTLKVEGLLRDQSDAITIKQWRQMDNKMFEENRKWFMKEISERDNKLSQLSLEIRAKEMQWKNSELNLAIQLKKVESERIALEEKLALKEEALDRVTASIEQKAEKNRLEIKNLQEDLKIKEELAEFYKNNLEKSEKLSEDLGEKLAVQQDLIQQSKSVLEEVRAEWREEKSELQLQIDKRDTQLFEMQDEMNKLNELLKSKHAVSLNVTEEELAQLSPAAAETSRFMKSGSSLTSLVRDHARLAGELASEKEKGKQLEETLQEIVKDIEENMPQFSEQREQLNRLFDENSRLKEQLQSAEDSRMSVESNRDQALRELAFTKAELEKYQRDCQQSSKKIQRLLFVMETQGRDTRSPPLTSEDEDHLFDNISQLQKVNAQLESELAAEKSSSASRHITAQNSELLILRQELQASRDTEHQLSEQLEQINVAFDSIREQNEKLMELHKDETVTEQLRDLKLKYSEVSTELEASRMSTVRFEATISNLHQEKISLAQISDTRLCNQQKLIDELKALNAKLEAKFEYQNQIAETNAKELELMQKDIQRVEKENDEFKRADDDNARKIAELHQEILKIHDKYGRCRTEKSLADAEIQRYVALVARHESQLECYRNRMDRDAQIQASLQDFNSRLNKIQQDKDGRLRLNNELLSNEKDELRQDLNETAALLRRSRREKALLETRLDNEVSLLAQQLVEKDEHIKMAESTLHELKLKLERLQCSTSGNQTDDMSPERLRKECQQLTNRVKFMETQLEDAKVQLEAYRAEVQRNSSETQRMESHSDRLETGLKDVKQMASFEQQRLLARAEAAERRASDLAEQIVELQTLVDQKTTEFEQFQLVALQTDGNLRVQIEVLQHQIVNANTTIGQQNERISNLMREISSNQSIVDTCKTTLSDVQAQADEANSRCEILNNRLITQQQQLLAAEENVQRAEYVKGIAQQALQQRTEEAEKAEAEFRENMGAQDAKVVELLSNYKELVEKMGPATDPHLSELVGADITNFDLPQAALQEQQRVIEFLRKEKETAVSRAITAEIEMKKAQSESAVYIAEREFHIGRVKLMEVAAATSETLALEKAELMKQIEALNVTTSQYNRVRADKDNLQKLLADTQKKAKDAEDAKQSFQMQVQEANVKVTAVSAELDKKNKELEAVKTTLQRQAARQPNQAAAVQVQKMTLQLSQKQNEIDKVSQQLQKTEQEKENVQSRFEQTRNLARKYRDELNAYKKAHPEGGTASDAGTSAVSDANVEKLKKEIEVKTNEHMEASFRLNLLTSKLTMMEEKTKEMQSKIDEKDLRNQTLERMLQAHGAPLTVTTSVSSSVLPNRPPPTSAAQQSESVVEEPEISAAAVETVSPPDAGLNLDMENFEAEAVPNQPATSSTRAMPGIQLFGRSLAPPSHSGANALVEEPVSGQNLVSASDSAVETIDDVQNDSESRESYNMPVSSTGGARKRAAEQSSSQIEAKRQRETSNEAVSSSEERMGRDIMVRDDDAGFIPDPVHADQQNDDDIIPLDPPNQAGNYFDEDEEDVGGDEDDDIEEIQNVDDEEEGEIEEDSGQEDDDMNDEFEVPDSDEGASEMDNADDSDDSGEEEGDVHPPQVIGSEDDDVIDANVDQDVEVIGADDNSRSQPILDDQDREAASAVEEADDEGRVSADGGVPNEAVHAAASSSAPRRAPITFERDDQCSSSNETGTSAQARGGPNLRRPTVRPTRGVYEPKRGAKGFTRGRGKK